MKLVETNTWNTVNSWQAGGDGGHYCGVAIGPESHEALVRVNGFVLQGGRVLPMAGQRYDVERINGDSTLTDIRFQLASITRLQLVLFESPSEMLSWMPRPTATFSLLSYATTGVWPNYDRVLYVPFTGRRQALFVIRGLTGAATLGGFNVWGRRWVASRKADAVLVPGSAIAEITETCLVTQAATLTSPAGAIQVGGPGETGGPPATFGGQPVVGSFAYAFYIGGMDNAEEWHELVLEIGAPGAGSVYDISVAVMGENGSS